MNGIYRMVERDHNILFILCILFGSPAISGNSKDIQYLESFFSRFVTNVRSGVFISERLRYKTQDVTALMAGTSINN